MKWLKEKIKNLKIWLKEQWKRLLIALGFVSFAAVGIVSALPPSITVNGEVIKFENCQQFSNAKDFKVCSDSSNYSGDSKIVNYLYVRNDTGFNAQRATISPYVKRGEIEILSVEKLVKNAEIYVEEPVFENQCVDIPISSTTKQTEQICNDVQTGTRLTPKTGDKWEKLSTNVKEGNNLEVLYDDGSRKEFFPKSNFKVSLNDGEEAYFKVVLAIPKPPRAQEEYLWNVLSDAGRGVLDPTIDSSSWSYYFSITATTSITGTHTDFPLLYNGVNAPANCTSNMQADGDDIRFTTTTPDGGTIDILDHEKVSATTTAGSWEYWFRDGSFSSSTTGEVYYVLCGNGSATDISTTSVWSSAYQGVWHLTTTTDSTINARNLTWSGTLPNDTNGKIGTAQDFNGSSDFATDGDIDLTSALSLQVIASTTNTGAQSRLLAKPHTADANPFNLYSLVQQTDNTVDLEISIASTRYRVESTATITDGAWHFITGTFDGSQLKMYIDTASTTASQSGSVDTNNQSLGIGRLSTPTPANYFNGDMDEVRITNNTLGFDWISAEYKMMNDQSTFWSVGTATSVPAAAVAAPEAQAIFFE